MDRSSKKRSGGEERSGGSKRRRTTDVRRSRQGHSGGSGRHSADYTRLPESIRANLSTYQSDAFGWLKKVGMLTGSNDTRRSNKGAYLAWEMGMGKTVTAVACFAMALFGVRHSHKCETTRAIVVIQRCVLPWWRAEFERIKLQYCENDRDFPRITIEPIEQWCRRGQRGTPEHVVILTTYDMLLTRLKRLQKQFTTTDPCHALILDEAHCMCNANTQRAEKVAQIAETSVNVLAISGTVIRNNVHSDLNTWARISNHPMAEGYPAHRHFHQDTPERLLNHLSVNQIPEIANGIPQLQLKIESVFIENPIERCAAIKAFEDLQKMTEPSDMFRQLMLMRKICEFPPHFVEQVRLDLLSRYPRRYQVAAHENSAQERNYGVSWMLRSFFYMLPKFLQNIVEQYLRDSRYKLGTVTSSGRYAVTRAQCQKKIRSPARIVDRLADQARKQHRGSTRFDRGEIVKRLMRPVQVFYRNMTEYGNISFGQSKFTLVESKGELFLKDPDSNRRFHADELGRGYSDLPLSRVTSGASRGTAGAAGGAPADDESEQVESNANFRLMRMRGDYTGTCTMHAHVRHMLQKWCKDGRLCSDGAKTSKVLISCFFKAAGHQLQGDILQDAPNWMSVGVINGDSSAEDIAELTNPNTTTQVWIVNSTMTEALNLQHINIVISLTPLWTPGADLQFWARCCRRGQKRKVRVYKLVARVRGGQAGTLATAAAQRQLYKLGMLRKYWEDIGATRSTAEQLFEDKLTKFVEDFTDIEKKSGTAYVSSDEEESEEEGEDIE